VHSVASATLASPPPATAPSGVGGSARALLGEDLRAADGRHRALASPHLLAAASAARPLGPRRVDRAHVYVHRVRAAAAVRLLAAVARPPQAG
jgi:hypothetical protein